ncbi:MAG: Zinc transporter ZupT [Microgenomates bacterium OLB23]|nr:MAG: Zinc transporter ZupT [Microgenomates bacterium OLB23]
MLLQIILANLAVSLVSFVGLATLVNKSFFFTKNVHLLVSFAAGVMLSAAFFDILPEALEHMDLHDGLKLVFWSIIGAFIVEKLLWHHHHHNDTHGTKPTTYLVLLGDTLHNFVDGLAIAASFMVNPLLGITTTAAILAHEIPQELADFAVLISTGVARKKALLLNFVSALAAVLGGIVGYYFLAGTENLTHQTLAVAGGVFVYIAAADLIPELHREQKDGNLFSHIVPLLFGVAILLILSNIFAH